MGQESDTEHLDRRAGRGMRLLLSRQVLTQLLGLVGGVVMARLLSPAEFGLYAIITVVVSVFSVFGDLGLTALFIQRKETFTEEDLQRSFTAQVGFATLVVAVVWVAAPWVLAFYAEVPAQAVWWVRVFALSLYLNAFRAVTSVQLERRLEYGPVVRTEVAENGVYHLTTVLLAWSGAGVWSFVLGSLARAVVGAIGMYRAAPWPVRLRGRVAELKALLRSSFRFQVYGPLNAIANWVIPTAVGVLVGPAGVGYLGLATANAKRPLLVVEAVMRVTLPHFARLQASPEALRERILAYLCGLGWLCALWTVMMGAVGPDFIELLYSARWLPAVPVLLLVAAALPLDVVSWTMGQAFTAAGRPWVPVRVVTVRSLLTVGLAVALVPWLGLLGAPLAYVLADLVAALQQLTSFQRGFFRASLRATLWMVPCAVLAAAAGRGMVVLVQSVGPLPAVVRLVAGGLVAGVLYLATSALLAPSGYRAWALARLRPFLHATLRRTPAASPPP